MTRAISIVVLFSACLWAKDKPEAKPALTAGSKVNILQAQRDLANAIIQAQPYNIRVEELRQRVLQEIENATKDVDQTKWTLDRTSLEYQPALPADKTAPASDSKPAPSYDSRPKP